MRMLELLTVCIVLLGQTPAPAAMPAMLTDHETVALADWIKKHPELRVSTDKDCQCDEDLSRTRTVGPWGKPLPAYEPYIAAGDFNADGKADFAVVFTKRQHSGNTGLLVIFDGAAYKPVYLHTVIGLHHRAFFRSHDGRYLGVGPFESEGCLYLPDKHSYREDCGNP